jgi:hypothetical protein
MQNTQKTNKQTNLCIISPFFGFETVLFIRIVFVELLIHLSLLRPLTRQCNGVFSPLKLGIGYFTLNKNYKFNYWLCKKNRNSLKS